MYFSTSQLSNNETLWEAQGQWSMYRESACTPEESLETGVHELNRAV